MNILYSDDIISKSLHDFKSYNNIKYMRHNYNNNIMINQNFIENTPNNLY